MLARTETALGEGYFTLSRPERSSAVLVEVPHAGLSIPDVVASELDAPADGVLRDADIYVDRLCVDAPARGASLLVAHASRYVVDLNRAADDVDPRTVPDHPAPRGQQPRGVVWRMTTDGRALMRAPLSYAQLQARLERFHRPYHDAIRAELARMRARHGFGIVLAAHSMPSTGRSAHDGRGLRRADVVPGTRGRTTADPRLIDLVDAHFRAAGLSVRHDEPYRGGFTTSHYGRPREGWHALQIELNRALYVDEATCEPKPTGFEALRKVLAELVTKVVALDLSG